MDRRVMGGGRCVRSSDVSDVPRRDRALPGRSIMGLAAVLAMGCSGSRTPAPARDSVRAELAHTERRPGVAKVPAQAPDTSPNRAFLDSLGFVESATSASPPWVRSVIDVIFREGATQANRQAAIDAVNGVVIGGRRPDDDEGDYFVLIPERSMQGMMAAMRTLRRQQGVKYADPVVSDFRPR